MNQSTTSDRLRIFRRFAWAACAALAVVLAGVLLWKGSRPDFPEARSTGEAAIRSEFSLVDHTGRRVTAADYAGKWQIVFFGFTHCPDVCPTTLGYLGTVLDELGDDADRVAPLFITVDPDRDTVPVLADYVATFHPRLIGLTGTEAEVSAAMRSFRAWAERAENSDAAHGYTMAHPGYIYVMDPQGGFVDVFQEQDQAPEQMAEEIQALIEGKS